MAVSNYYFDGHVYNYEYGPPGVPANISNLIDGDTSSVAFFDNSEYGYSASLTSGTDAPSSGGEILLVEVRLHNGTVYSPYYSIPVPTQGWSWSLIKNELTVILEYYDVEGEIALTYSDDGGSGGWYAPDSEFWVTIPYISKIELRVTSEDLSNGSQGSFFAFFN